MQDIYSNGKYLASNENWHSEDSEWKFKQVEKIITRNNLSISNFVEIGCGAGLVLDLLSRKFPNSRFQGFDISPHLYNFWNKLSHNKVKYFCQDFLDYETNSMYDICLIMDVFEHVPNYMGFLNSLSKRANFFIFNIPLDMNAIGVFLDQQSVARQKYGHLHYFSKSTAIQTLEECGYTIVDYFYAPGFYGQPVKNLQQRMLYPFRFLLYSISPEANSRILGGASLMVLASSSIFNSQTKM
jgi:SAM-dependent methyltransferase